MRTSLGLFPLFFFLGWLSIGCGETSATPDLGGPVHIRFELAEAPLDFGAIPFPDDLYIEDGGIALGAFPDAASADRPMIESLRASLRSLDGFGVTTPVFFELDGPIHPDSLPRTPGETLAEDASVFLIDADPSSPTAFARIPGQVRWDPVRLRISIQPVDGRPLIEGRRYAAVVTSGVRTSEGELLAPSARFARIRDASARPEDSLDARAYDEHAPVLASLAAHGLVRAEVVGLAVFTVQSVGRTLARARDEMRAAPVPALRIERVVSGADLDALLGTPRTPIPGGDVEGGVLHEHIAYVIDARFPTRELASPAPWRHGAWTLGSDGSPVVRRTDEAWMTLILPVAADLTSVPVIVYQHGLGGQRGDVFEIADTLCSAGFAVAAIDIPYHGMRRQDGAEDVRHQYGAARGPDLFGDSGGDTIYLQYLGIADNEGDLVPFHPFYARDVLRQSALDLMTLVRVLEDGDFSAALGMGAPEFSLASAEVGFVGVSLGGILGTIFVANEPAVGASVLSVTGGHLCRLVEQSPSFATRFLGLLLPSLGYELHEIDWDANPPSALPGVAIFQTLLDRGDPLAHTSALAAREVHLLLHMAKDDETVPNVATESLAAAVGMPMIAGTPVYTSMEVAEAPVQGNAMVGRGTSTRGLVVWEPATHGMLGRYAGQSRWMRPLVQPFRPRTPALDLVNPVEDAQAQMRSFFATWSVGIPEIAAPLGI